MVPSARQRSRRARAGQLLPICVLAGVLIVAMGTVTAVTVYLGRLSSTVDSMAKAAPLESYEGRPDKPLGQDATAPVDFLLLVSDSDHRLLSVHLVNLSGSRQELTLVGLPSDLLVASGPRKPLRTLADLYRQDAHELARHVELLLGVRTDHQVQLAVEGFSTVVDALGGLEQMAAAPADGHAGPDGYLASAPDAPARAERVAQLVRGTMVRLGMVDAMSNPVQFDNVLRALEHCTLVDSNLTTAELEATLMESSVRSEEMRSYVLPSVEGKAGRTAVPADLAALREALAADQVASLA